ncbi:MAG: hypothetical protein GEU94_01645 [Micromonosporaceae bacterium]|nr:hypothetical protein [Micromonosporaceae bacterium]
MRTWRGVVLTSLITGLIAAFLSVTVPRGLVSAMDWWSDRSDAPVLRATVVSAMADSPDPSDAAWALRRPLSAAQVRAWNGGYKMTTRGLAARHAVPIGRSLVSVVLENTREEPVVLVGMRAEIQQRRTPPDGALIIRGPIGGEPSPRVDVVFDLDEPRPEARRFNPETELGGDRYFESVSITLARGEKIVFNLRANSLTCQCRWRVAIDMEVDGAVRHQTVDRPSKPFWVTGPAKAYQTAYKWNGEHGLAAVTSATACSGDCTKPGEHWITRGGPR